MSELALRVGGCRGSMSVFGPDHARFGGNTTSFYAEVEPDHHLVIDAGTGIRRLQHEVADRGPQEFTILLTHYHWDHIQGLPVFGPLFEAGNRVNLIGPELGGLGPQESLDSVMCSPWWPVSLDEAAAELTIEALAEGPIEIAGVKVTHAQLHHPDGVVGYRLTATRSIVIATDQEAGEPASDARLRELAAGAHILIHDGQYTPDETKGPRRGWGHSDWKAAATVARDAAVGHLILTSHDPDRTDVEIDALRGEARALFPRTDAAYEGLELTF
jgi:phosphoribosyl 1,2-cyclic phosphodiesterase